MNKNIDIQCHSELIECNNDSMEMYMSLRDAYNEDQIFLLESISGPERDCNKSIIAFDPIFNIGVKGNEITLNGNKDIIKTILKHPHISPYISESTTLFLPNSQTVIGFIKK